MKKFTIKAEGRPASGKTTALRITAKALVQAGFVVRETEQEHTLEVINDRPAFSKESSDA